MKRAFEEAKLEDTKEDVEEEQLSKKPPLELNDALLDILLPEGYKIVPVPENYEPITIGANKMKETPKSNGFTMVVADPVVESIPIVPEDVPDIGALQFFKEADAEHFKALVGAKDIDSQDLKVLKLLLRIKNGVPTVRKQAMRQITEEARAIGAPTLFGQIIPLLKTASLDEKERHLLIKVLSRVLFQLQSLAAPFTHKILVVVQPLLVDADVIARKEGREVILSLSEAVGLKTMLSTLRSDIDHPDEFVRNTTAESLAIVGQALGIQRLLPFLAAAVRTQDSWHAKFTGLRTIHYLGRLVGCAVLPYLTGLVAVSVVGLNDGHPKIRSAACIALSTLAEASSPYGIEAFEIAMEPLWVGVRHYRGKALAGCLRALGALVPLMDPESSKFYTKRVLEVAIKQFPASEDEMRKVVLQVVRKCCASDGLELSQIRDALPDFFQNFWIRRIALEKRLAWLVVETTNDIASRVGTARVVEQIVERQALTDSAEKLQTMAFDAIKSIAQLDSLVDISERLEQRLVDALVTALAHRSTINRAFIKAFSEVFKALGPRARPYLGSSVTELLNQLNKPVPELRQQASLIIGNIANTIQIAGEETFLLQLSAVLYEQLGEEYPATLAAVLSGIKGIVSVVGLEHLQPPVSDLLPRLTPILRNPHEQVQENCIILVGRIADLGAEYANPREWIRICYELLELMKASRMSIRRVANDTFGYIAKGIGPQDVLATLLSNLRVQERQSRVNTAVALGIVANVCEPFTVLPVLLNEYRAPDQNVQHGVLKALAFMFEYIGPQANDYLHSVVSLIDHALTDKDQVHRQIAASAVKHIALDCQGMDHEDVMVHFLNELIPNIFETSPHLIDRVMEGMEGLRNALGPGIFLSYIWAGLFHPARKVRETYWILYNSTYIQSADAMVPYYPVDVPEMDVWI
ncbi:U2 snRNP component prp10 [Wickerhamiella sorbophila]|uniref:U2 snRNP component prp10 n=1 Tax=Wickerhamiella sorbophila TaxID=45607 RepID=A0A2T0FII7_9ASCO|nr:U2 snRNP component prp10 [Wickerhamiella sorbophila]PRT54813.1 U2 snRNP component prp10 [Wickerhamiella sorbophila]